jgi:ribosomal protein S18 acetylase RimI-like enzyme
MARLAVAVREASPDDLGDLGLVDTSYRTDRIYRVRRSELGFWLDEERVDPPVHKTNPRPQLELGNGLFVACVGTELAGYAELLFEAWNGRARIEHIYVSGGFRGRGVGRALIQAVDERARQEHGARCLWLETQNVNYPAVQFYRQMGFQLCGLDESLYRPGDPALLPGEVALYFSRDLASVT